MRFIVYFGYYNIKNFIIVSVRDKVFELIARTANGLQNFFRHTFELSYKYVDNSRKTELSNGEEFPHLSIMKSDGPICK